MNDAWRGLRPEAAAKLSQRDYSSATLSKKLSTNGVEASALIGVERAELGWIPGVEIFSRQIFPQRDRGFFGEFARRDEGPLAAIGLWPAQWATATMFAGTAKGFHIHPPHLPPNEEAANWFRRLYVDKPNDHAARPYALEQWDAMFFVQGTAEMFLVDERAGLERRVMRFFVEGDDARGPNNVGVVIPPGVAHAIRADASRNVIMVYGTSTKFAPEAEGRIASGIETASLPEDWAKYLVQG